MVSHPDEQETERVCPGCDAPESDWVGAGGAGVVARDGELHCCEQCASGRACGCNTERAESLIKKKSA